MRFEQREIKLPLSHCGLVTSAHIRNLGSDFLGCQLASLHCLNQLGHVSGALRALTIPLGGPACFAVVCFLGGQASPYCRTAGPMR